MHWPHQQCQWIVNKIASHNLWWAGRCHPWASIVHQHMRCTGVSGAQCISCLGMLFNRISILVHQHILPDKQTGSCDGSSSIMMPPSMCNPSLPCMPIHQYDMILWCQQPILVHHIFKSTPYAFPPEITLTNDGCQWTIIACILMHHKSQSGCLKIAASAGSVWCYCICPCGMPVGQPNSPVGFPCHPPTLPLNHICWSWIFHTPCQCTIQACSPFFVCCWPTIPASSCTQLCIQCQFAQSASAPYIDMYWCKPNWKIFCWAASEKLKMTRLPHMPVIINKCTLYENLI